MIDRLTYLMGRDAEYPTTEQIEINIAALLFRVNQLLKHLGISNAGISSGYRPGKYNQNFAQKSAHLSGEAVDIIDVKGELKAKVTPDLLEQFNLYAEDFSKTPTWLHLQTRPASSRIFKV